MAIGQFMYTHTRLALPRMLLEVYQKDAGGGSESRVGTAAWKLALPNIFHYNILLVYEFASLYPFRMIFSPVSC